MLETLEISLKNEMSKTLPAELEVLVYLRGEGSLLVYISRLMYIAFDTV